jgi:hypothetical protein
LAEALSEWPYEAEREFWADVCATRRHPHWYWWFLKIAMGYEWYMSRPGNLHWLTERVHLKVCDWWQGFIEAFIEDRYAGRKHQWKVAFEMPRGWGKTQCISIPTPLAIFLEFPNLGWGDGSENIDKAAELMIEPQRAVLAGEDSNSWFTWLYGTWLTPNASTSTARRPSRQYLLTHDGRTDLSLKDQSLRCWGVRGGVTGKHPDGGCMDDPVSEEAIRDKSSWLILASRHMDSMFYAFAPSCLVGFPHTRYRDEDPAGVMFRDQGVCEWAGDPCPDDLVKVTKDGAWHVYYVDCYDKDNHSQCPEIETTRSLHKQEAGNPVSFSAQKRNQPGRGEHQLITHVQMRGCLIDKAELPQSGFLYLHCNTNFEDLSAIGSQDSVVLATLQDPRHNGVTYLLEGYGGNTLRIEDYARLVCRLITKARQDPLWKRYTLAGITDACVLSSRKSTGTWFTFLRQYAAGAGIQLAPLIDLPRNSHSRDARVVRAVGYALDKRLKIVDGAPNNYKVMAELVKYYTARGGKDDWAHCMADAFDDVIYRAATTAVISEPRFHRRRGVDGSFNSDREIWDEDAGVFDSHDIDYV